MNALPRSEPVAPVVTGEDAATAARAARRWRSPDALLLLLGILVAAVAVSGTGLALQQMRDRRAERVQELELAARLVAAHVSDRLRMRIVMAQVLARVAPPDGHLPTPEIRQRWLLDVQGRYGLAGLALLRADGTLVAGAGDAAMLSPSLSADAAQVGLTGEPMLHRLERRADGARPVAAWIDVILPRSSPLPRYALSGAVSGSASAASAVAAPYDPASGLLLVRLAADQELQTLLAGAGLRGAAQLVLLRRGPGSAAGSLSWQAVTPLRDQPDSVLEATVDLTPSARTVAAAEGGAAPLTVTLPIAGTPWMLQARDDAAEPVAAWPATVLATLQGTVLALIALALLGVGVWRQRRTGAGPAAAVRRTPRGVQHDLQLLARHAPDATLLVDDSEQVVEANERAAQLFRQPRTTLIGTPVQALLREAAASAETWRVRWNEMTRTEQLIGLDHERPDGGRIPLELATRAIELDGQRFVRMAVRDVSERRRQETELRASEARFRAVAEAAPVGIFLGDLEGNRVYANARMAELTGWPQAPLGGPPRRDLFHPADRERASAEFDASFAERRATRVEMRLLWPDGSVRWVVVQTEPERAPDGSVTGFVGTLTDVTSLRTMREETERRARLLQTVFDSPFVCTAVVDADSGNVTMVNQAMCELLGYTRDELLHSHWARTLPPDEHRRAREPIHDMYSGRIDGYRARRRYLRRDGTTVRVLVDVRCLRLTDGRVDSVVAVATVEA